MSDSFFPYGFRIHVPFEFLCPVDSQGPKLNKLSCPARLEQISNYFYNTEITVINTLHAMDKFSRRKIDDIFSKFSQKKDVIFLANYLLRI